MASKLRTSRTSASLPCRDAFVWHRCLVWPAGAFLILSLVPRLSPVATRTFACSIVSAARILPHKQDPTSFRSLDPSATVETELAAGQTHRYRLSLNAGQYVRVIVTQKGIDVAVFLLGPNETQLADVSLPHTLQGPKEIIALIEQTGEHRLEIRSQNKDATAGRYEVRVADLREASENDKTRVAVRKIVAEASSLRKQGSAESLAKAIEKLETALPLIRSIGDREGESEALGNIGAAHYSLSHFEETIATFNLTLPIWRETGDLRGQAVGLSFLAAAQNRLGRWEDVIESLKTALPIYQSLGDRKAEATTLNNIGSYYGEIGDSEKALEYLAMALPIKRETGDRIGEAQVLGNIGVFHYARGETQKAIESYEPAISISREVGDKTGEAVYLLNEGNAYKALGNQQPALDKLKTALALAREVGARVTEAKALGSAGEIHALLGDKQAALENMDASITILHVIGDRPDEARVLGALAGFQALWNQLSEARAHIEAALAIDESLRARIPDQQLRSLFFATVQGHYQLYIDILMRQRGEPDSEALTIKALETSERARSRSLLDLLKEARIEIRQGVDKSLLERERASQQSLNLAAEQQIRLLSGKHTHEQAETIAKRIATLTTELEEVEARIRQASPRYAELTRPQPLSLKQIQDEVLDPDTLILEYRLGDVHSYVWTVAQNGVSASELPARLEIEKATRHFYDLLKTNAKAEEIENSGAQLGQMLLGPVIKKLGNRRLVIVADGALQYLPFGALQQPDQLDLVSSQRSAKPKTAANYRPLIVDHEIVSLPSASTLAVLRHENAARAPASKLVAVFADPVFDVDDVRLRRSANPLGGQTKPVDAPAYLRLRRSLEETGLGNGAWPLPRLLGTRREAGAILKFVPESKRKQALDFEANRLAATGSEIGQYQIVHFATHGILNSNHPELSGIVLSLVDQRGQQQNGFLRLNEIYDLQLKADLVVLSACQTGLGKEIRGEGMIGLARGFMYAGAPRLVTSLWQVDDKATSELMERFYRGMLVRKLSAGAALREAQIAMWHQRDWRSPYYWAAFTLQGEWK